MSKKGWDKLTPAQREIVQKKTTEAGAYFSELVNTYDASSMKRRCVIMLAYLLRDLVRLAQGEPAPEA